MRLSAFSAVGLITPDCKVAPNSKSIQTCVLYLAKA
jgi:hypothetical protein